MVGLLDRLRAEIDRGVVHLGARSKLLVESTHARSQMRLLQKHREEGISELGRVAYGMLRSGTLNHARLEPYISAIQQIDDQMSMLEQQLHRAEETADSAMRGTTASRESYGSQSTSRSESSPVGPVAIAYCSCGQALRPTSRYCPACGADVREIVERAAASPAERRACASCGASVDTHGRFCPSCGASLVWDVQDRS